MNPLMAPLPSQQGDSRPYRFPAGINPRARNRRDATSRPMCGTMKQGIIALLFAIVSACTATGEEMLTFVTVGDPGNPADQLPASPTGDVPYAFRIQKYETTIQEWVTFLNAVDPLGGNGKSLADVADTNLGYERTMTAPYGHKYSVKTGMEQLPVERISANSARRFANWIQGGITESGVYNMASATPGMTKSANALYWIPTPSEWHKAAYYQGPNSPQRQFYGTDYSLYPMGGFTASPWTTTLPNSANFADYSQFQPTQPVMAVGSFTASPSHYGTFDQGGNVPEMVEDNGLNYTCGGSAWEDASIMEADNNFEYYEAFPDYYGVSGLRLAASAPQPTVIAPALQIESAIKLSWLSTTTNRYRIQSSTDMISWADEDILLQGTGNQMTSFQSITDTRKYFRVQILP